MEQQAVTAVIFR